MWTLLGALFATPAGAAEYLLEDAASAWTYGDVLTIAPRWVEVTRPDFVMKFELRNETDAVLLVHATGLRCGRGPKETMATYAVLGIGDRQIDLMPRQTEIVRIVCDHGKHVSGPLSLKIDVVYAGTPLLEDLVWTLAETDLVAVRQQGQAKLATGSFRAATPKPLPQLAVEPAPAVVAPLPAPPAPAVVAPAPPPVPPPAPPPEATVEPK